MDDISDQEYRISLKSSSNRKNETKEHNISAIHFAVEKIWRILRMQHMNTSFCEGQVIAVNPSTGKTTVRNDTEKAAEHLLI